jgi:DNA-binding response OmpR family regulator
MRVFFVHWNQLEAEARARDLAAAGHEVRTHWSGEQDYKWGEYLPDAVVISLDRLPSHGRAVAEWVWEAKKRRHIPVVFVGGTPEKVKATREKFPNGKFCAWEEVVGVLVTTAAP